MGKRWRLAAFALVVGGVLAIAPGPAHACTLPAPSAVVSETTVMAGQSLDVDLSVYEFVPDSERTTTTTNPSTTDLDPSGAECPQTRPVSGVVLRFVQRDVATDLVTIEQAAETRFTQTVTVPSTATAGPARIVVSSTDGEVIAQTEAFSVVAASPPAAPEPETPTFTG